MPTVTDFSSLLSSHNSRQFKMLRPAQESVLSEYNASNLETADLAIELPTGAGKSLIALLIGEVWLRDKRKVAILTGNKTLARQMEREAQALGVPSTRMEGAGKEIPATSKRAYQRAQNIAIMNYWVYFNQNPVIDPADLLIVDDSHLVEHCLHSLYSVEINRHSHTTLYRSLVAELASRFPEYSVLQCALDEDPQSTAPTELMSYLDQYAAGARIREIIDNSAEVSTDTDLRFRWNRLRDRYNEANLYLSTQTIWLRPYIYPLTANQHYSASSQRIYTSATIGDPADLARRLGTNPIEKLAIPDATANDTQGRRLVVMNRVEDSDLPSRLQRTILAALDVHPKSVWLCASVSEAQKFSQVVAQWLTNNGHAGHPTWILSSPDFLDDR